MSIDDTAERLRGQFDQLLKLVERLRGRNGGKACAAAVKKARRNFEEHVRTGSISSLRNSLESLTEIVMELKE